MHLDTIQRFLKKGNVSVEVCRLTLSYRSEAITIELGVDGKWRFVWQSDYGVGHFINGPGCDATGYVITDSKVLDTINQLTGR